MQFELQCKTAADLHREWARVLDMCEESKLNPVDCLKYDGVVYSKFTNQSHYPSFQTSPKLHEFAIAIVEGKPVFRGDELYWIVDMRKMAVNETHTLDTGFWTWTPPKPKEETYIANLPKGLADSISSNRQYHVGDYLHCKCDNSYLSLEGNGVIVGRTQTITNGKYTNYYMFRFDSNGIIIHADDGMLSPIAEYKISLVNLPNPTESWHTERCSNELSIHFKFKTPEEATAMEKIVLGQLSKQM